MAKSKMYEKNMNKVDFNNLVLRRGLLCSGHKLFLAHRSDNREGHCDAGKAEREFAASENSFRHGLAIT